MARKASTPQFVKQLGHQDPVQRATALEALDHLNHPIVLDMVIKALDDTHPLVRSTAAQRLGMTGKKGRSMTIRHLIAKLCDRHPEVRMRVAESLGILLARSRRSPAELVRKLRDPDELVRIEVADSLGAIRDAKALGPLWKAIQDRSPLVRSYVAGAIGELGDKADKLRLEREVRRECSEIAKVGYYQAIAMLGGSEATENLVGLLSSKNYKVRCAVAHTLSDVVASRGKAASIVGKLAAALKRENTVAGRSSIGAAVREIRSKFLKYKKRGADKGIV